MRGSGGARRFTGWASQWGDIHITSSPPLAEQRATLYHELVHRALTPKLHALRGLRVTISQNGYANSHLLRYIEEAMCETYGKGALDEHVRVSPGSVRTGGWFSPGRKTWVVWTHTTQRGGNRVFEFDAETGELLKDCVLPR